MAEHLDRDKILEQTNGGLEIFDRLIPDLPRPYKKGKLFPSVFREEHTPSANLFLSKKTGFWLYKDFGSSSQGMNAIDFLMELKKVDFKEALKLAADVANLMPADYKRAPLPVEVILRPDPYKSADLLTKTNSIFHLWAGGLGVPESHLSYMGVGTYRLRDVDFTCFVFVNYDDQPVNWKWMYYQRDGHRDKATPPRSLVGKNPGEVYRLCLFGEFQLKLRPKDPVCIVESEKSAVLASYFYPDFVWLATAGLNGGDPEDYKRVGLADQRPVRIFCDADPVRKIPKAFQILSDLGANVQLVDLFPERQDKSDIADYIAEGYRLPIPAFSTELPAWAKPKEERKKHYTEFAQEDFEYDDERFQIESLIPAGAFKEEDYDPLDEAMRFRFFRYRGQYFSIHETHARNQTIYSKRKLTNFTMRVLYHMEGRKNSRLIEIKNCYGATKTLETDTANLVSKAKFKEFTEAAGNFLFYGGDTELMNLKTKLFMDEVPCQIVEVLGQYGNEFFSFSNGIYRNQSWHPVDDKGIIVLDNSAYYIPYGNKSYQNNSTMFNNEKKVKHTPEGPTFSQWIKMHQFVFGDPGKMGVLFGISCLFSDIIFSALTFFPLMFLYGEGGSGKGQLIRSIQYLFGKPQDPLLLNSDANTSKSKIREMAQFRNLLLCLEEYRNGDEKTVNMLKGLWDRFGYKRANKDNGYGNESVPINSGAMVTGNDYPVDDPLIQRLLILEMHKNARTQEQIDAFWNLTEIQESGITTVTLEILNHRDLVEAKFREAYLVSLAEIRKLMSLTKITDRMAGNMAVIDAMYCILDPVLKFGWTVDELRMFMCEAMQRQEAKRDTGSEVQKFWDVVLTMANRGDILENREVKFDGDTVFIRFTELHGIYSMVHRQIHGQPGMQKQTLLDKLKRSEAYQGTQDTVKYDDRRTSGIKFSVSKLGVDLVGAFEFKRKQNFFKDLNDKAKADEEEANSNPPANTAPVQLSIVPENELPF